MCVCGVMLCLWYNAMRNTMQCYIDDIPVIILIHNDSVILWPIIMILINDLTLLPVLNAMYSIDDRIIMSVMC